MVLPEDAAERVRGWAEGEEAKAKEREELLTELIPAVEAKGYNAEAVKGGCLSGFLDLHAAAQGAV